MASPLLRSAAGRVLRGSIPLGSFRRSPDRFLPGGIQRIESQHFYSNYKLSPEDRLEMALEKFDKNLRKAHEETLSLLEQEKRFKRQEQRQKGGDKQEELEKLQKEGNAALEARRVEAEAESKRKLDLEREKARQALQEMEKTVEINDIVHPKDLEMLACWKSLDRFMEVDEEEEEEEPCSKGADE